MSDRLLEIPDPVERANLSAFVTRVNRLDEAAVVRMRVRGSDTLTAWAPTGFDVLAVRVVTGVLKPSDVTVAGDVLMRGLESHAAGVDLGFPMDSSWRGALPPDQGFVHIDDVPARALVSLAQRGVEIAREHGRTPSSLLDSKVLTVTGAGDEVTIAMRTVFALNAMGFIPVPGNAQSTDEIDPERIDPNEMVRVRASKTWLRLDARFGSIATRRGSELSVMVRS
ncbi:hypothetical protein [Smaragdicoccus niigatensis]|uniref:hypothetical protein n=1 Tax=Smaragdicoccus niigatensis TaxID=359359 RepID=UPI000363BAD5|nr:hypothetical protein [Smaragdicoccus niigatensis]